ncbi:MAG: hypothetical protein COW03_06895 [Cytophagales bacterium CG12_big_fil_rev_8_21_14_0_65_40_12]|nr:MAG: hypothetical protein COW03_06895 [Cytophagales bacterium CG12_big_fil_rev_8_21_14_0_65_40_12]PIW02841.1 MAG: hypothetical protein COW40_17815 [Cytophagales bacterium CG17_big_fil_post_rev_8_21_14_2_50_40_13]
MRVSVYIFCLILVFSGCAPKDGSTLDDGSQLVDIFSIRSTDSLISPRSLMTEVEYIKLKSPEAFYLTDAQKMLELDGKILILDKNKQVLMAYDLGGNFLGQVGQKGLGPEEYKSATDFAVDLSSRSIFIFSRGEQSILEFNSDLSFRRKSRINTWAFQMSMLKNQNLAFYSYFEEGNSNITLFNQKGEVLDSRMAFPKGGNYEIMDYTGFLVDQYYSYPLSSKIYALGIDDSDKEIFNIEFPNQLSEDKKFEHKEFLNGSAFMVEHILSNFAIGDNGNELLFYYTYKETGNSGFTLGVKLASGEIFGHLNLKHGRKDKSDPFVKLFFIGPYNIPVYSPASGYYYIATSNDTMDEYFYSDPSKALKEIKSLDSKLYEVLKESEELENPIIMRFKLKKRL